MNLSPSEIQAFQALCHQHGRKDMTESQAHASAVQLLEFLMLIIRSGDDKEGTERVTSAMKNWKSRASGGT